MNFGLSKKTWIFSCLIASVIGLSNFTRSVLGASFDLEWGYILVFFIDEMTGTLSVLPLVPFFLAVAHKYRLDTAKGLRYFPYHVGLFFIFASAHTFLMELMRAIIYPVLFNQTRSVDYFDRWLFELSTQAVTYPGLLALVYFADYYLENKNRQLQNALLTAQLTDAKMEVLRLQLNPHFLFNTLNMISSIMYENVDRADQMLTRLSDFLRHILNSSSQQWVRLSQEIEMVKHYVSIMEARFQELLEVEFEIHETSHEALIPNFLLQPIVENAIKHGRGAERETLKIDIHSHVKNHCLEVRVQDNGLGIQDLDSIFQKGTGLSTCQARLQQLYGNNFSFEVTNGKQAGATVFLKIPFQTETASSL